MHYILSSVDYSRFLPCLDPATTLGSSSSRTGVRLWHADALAASPHLANIVELDLSANGSLPDTKGGGRVAEAFRQACAVVGVPTEWNNPLRRTAHIVT